MNLYVWPVTGFGATLVVRECQIGSRSRFAAIVAKEEGARPRRPAYNDYMSQGTVRPRIRASQPLDISARLDEFRALKDGWLEGKGKAPVRPGLDWLAAAMQARFPGDLPVPHLYPTAEGGIQAEWSLPPDELSLEIDLAIHKATWHSLDVRTGHDDLRELNLDEDEDWRWLVDRIKRAAGRRA